MKLVKVTLVLAVVALLSAQADSALQRAIRKETLEGDLTGAIESYKKLAQNRDRAVAAQALVRMGQCYEKLGDSEARKAYERVVREFGDQKDLAETARTRLAALGRAGGLSVPSGITLRKVWEGSGEPTGSPSPDGRHHSFPDWETGDLAIRDLVTGQNRRLTNKGTWEESREYAEASVISGDGKQIAYAWYNKERFYELRVCGIDGSNPHTVYRDKEFGYWLEPYQWTADGRQVLAALMKEAPRETRFVLVPVAGGPARILPIRAQLPWYPSLSPDGRWLVYNATGEKPDDHDIFVLSLEAGQEVSLVRHPSNDWGPVWTPDGKKVLFINDRTGTNGFWAIDVVEGKPRGVPQLLKDGLGRVNRPNGFTRQGAFYFTTYTGVADVYVAELDLTAGKVVQEAAPVAQRLPGLNLAPSWSPDGRRLAYYSRRYPEKAPTLVIASVETGEARDVPVKLDQLLVPVRWFPDGKSVLVSARDSPERNQVAFYRVDAQTGDHRLVRSSPGPGPDRAELSPDGKTLFFFTGGEQKLWGGVISRDLETGQEREITRVPFMLPESGWTEPAISPDGRYLAFRRPVNESWTALMLVPAAGGELRELYRYPLSSEPERYGELSWTPDGRNVLCVRSTGKNGMSELWRIPIAGGEPQRTGLSVEGMRVVTAHPDGRRIAFDTGSRTGSPNELWVLENIPGAAESKPAAGAK